MYYIFIAYHCYVDNNCRLKYTSDASMSTLKPSDLKIGKIDERRNSVDDSGAINQYWPRER